MKEKFSKKLTEFLTGRYGGDPLNTVLSVTALVLVIIGSILGSTGSVVCNIIAAVLYLIAAAGLGFGFYRMLSRNLTARKAEYDWFTAKIVTPLKRMRSQLQTRHKQRKTHRFFKCPKCRQTVRVPRGKGKVKITCPKCGEVFVKET